MFILKCALNFVNGILMVEYLCAVVYISSNLNKFIILKLNSGGKALIVCDYRS